MHRCDNADSNGTGVGAYDASIAVYRDENPPSYDATQLRHQEMNAIQEEICNVIRAEGYALNADTESYSSMIQLHTAINNKLYADRITNNSGVAGSYVDDALNQLDSDITALDSDDIGNVSGVTGANVTAALNALDTKVDTFHGEFEFQTDNLHTGLEESNDMVLHASDHDSGTHVASGNVTVRGGRQGDGSLEDTGFDGGDVTIIGGNGCKARNTTGTRGGDVTVEGGGAGGAVSNSDVANPPGDVYIKGGRNARVSSKAGDAYIQGGEDPGDRSLGQAGHVHIRGGNHTNGAYTGTAGDVNIEPGYDSKDNDDGVVRIRGANSGANTLQMFIEDLPTSDPGIAGRLFTQTATQLGGSGTTKVICVS